MNLEYKKVCFFWIKLQKIKTFSMILTFFEMHLYIKYTGTVFLSNNPI